MPGLPTGFRTTALGTTPTCWTRVEHHERRFIQSCADHTDGVVVDLRFASLIPEAVRARVPHLVDLGVHRLPHLAGPDDESFGSDASTTVANTVPLPVRPEDLAGPALHDLVRASIAVQSAAEVIFAPDFAFDAIGSPWLDVNLRALQLTQALAGRARVGAWIHVPLEAVVAGIMPLVVARYRAALPAGAPVALTVYFPRQERRLDVDQQTAYFSAVAALDAAGFEVIVDRAGDLTLPAVATFAAGCMLGTRLYRTAPPSPRWSSEVNPRIPLAYSEARNGRRLPLRTAAERRRTGSLFRCPDGCVPLAPGARDKLDGRLHNAHDLRYEVRRLRALSAPAAVRVWSNSDYKVQREWAQALERVVTDADAAGGAASAESTDA